MKTTKRQNRRPVEMDASALRLSRGGIGPVTDPFSQPVVAEGDDGTNYGPVTDPWG